MWNVDGSAFDAALLLLLVPLFCFADLFQTTLLLELLAGSVFAVQVVAQGLSSRGTGQALFDRTPATTDGIFLDKASIGCLVVNLVNELAQDQTLVGLTGGIAVFSGNGLDHLFELAISGGLLDTPASSNDDVLLTRLEGDGKDVGGKLGTHCG